uniref:Retrotransposon protein, putative, Ty3-gypsy subclass n=1 Tax=Oryza sativa subsp. japonica TaxID=39947 RepID=Q109W8_ORYSJ|nr:retrotransposon protein, putative, Ty3-gypsy subclass [Oryza sativa Japonica Group]
MSWHRAGVLLLGAQSCLPVPGVPAVGGVGSVLLSMARMGWKLCHVFRPYAVVWFGGNANPCRRCSGARTGRRHWDIVFVAVEPEQAEPSHRTINISSVSSLKSLMNPCQWCSELGDRHCLPQFRLSSSTFDFSLSGESQFNSSGMKLS